MADCFCDYGDAEAFSVFRESWPTARKPHKCSECRKPINAGERYHRVFGVVRGERPTVHLTCCRCNALIDYTRAHIPCFLSCRTYPGGESVVDQALDALADHAREAPGLWFGGARLAVAAGYHGDAHWRRLR